MTARSGIGQRFAVAGVDMSADVGELGRVGGGPAALNVTGIVHGGPRRIGGRYDAAVEFMSFFNDEAGGIFAKLSSLPTADQVVTLAMSNAIEDAAAAVVAKQVNYDPTREDDGGFTFETQALGSAGSPLVWGNLLTPWPRADGSSATDGAGVDNGAATSAGLTAFLHVFAVTSGSATVKIQSSSDDGGGDAYADLVSFTAASAVGGERVEVAGAVEQWLRVVTTGTFTGLSIAVMAARG